jgi:hypothetical protein
MKKNLLMKVVPTILPLFYSVHIFASSVGDIQTSVLNTKEFQDLNGTEWVLMDGQTELPANNSLRLKTGWTKVPDARGRFFRMKDHGAGIDLSGDHAIGTLLSDLTSMPKNAFSVGLGGAHSHSMSTSGAHSHNVSGGDHSHQYVSPQGEDRLGQFNSRGAEGSRAATTQGSGGHSHNVSTEGNHTHAISTENNHGHSFAGGDPETKPKNIIVNYFIKIREKQEFDECSSIEKTSTQEEVAKRFKCLRSKLTLWEDNQLQMKASDSENLIREIVFMKRSSVGKISQDALKDINQLIQKYAHVLIIE